MTTTPELDEQSKAEIFSLLKTIRDLDSLDITDDEIRDGHHRIEGYVWLAEHAYRFGMERERDAAREELAKTRAELKSAEQRARIASQHARRCDAQVADADAEVARLQSWLADERAKWLRHQAEDHPVDVEANPATTAEPADEPKAELCTDKNGFHDGHDWTPDPCEPYRWYPGYPVPAAG